MFSQKRFLAAKCMKSNVSCCWQLKCTDGNCRRAQQRDSEFVFCCRGTKGRPGRWFFLAGIVQKQGRKVWYLSNASHTERMKRTASHSVPTWPVSRGSPGPVVASVTGGQKYRLPASGGVAPVVGFQDERALGAIRDHEAVDDMVELATVTAALIDVTHQLPRLAAIWRVLGRTEGKKVSIFFYCLVFTSCLPETCSLTFNNTRQIIFYLFALSVSSWNRMFCCPVVILLSLTCFIHLPAKVKSGRWCFCASVC